jgi:dihydroorotate dehydrogenase
VSLLSDLGAAVLRHIEPEQAHRLAIRGLAMAPLPAPRPDDPVLRTRLAGLDLSNPIGLAAGLDKNGEAVRGLSRLGFGFVECGSVTPRPQAGNPKPRLFRLAEARAVINRMGFNNDGLEAFAARLERRPAGATVGANLGANKDTEDKATDYVAGLQRLAGLASYFTVNISSPNTPGLRALQGRDQLDDLLGRIDAARPLDGDAARVPVFLKIAPDLVVNEIAMIVEAALAYRIDALIVSNTTLERPETLRSSFAAEAGGLSRGAHPTVRGEGAAGRRRGRAGPHAPDRGGRHRDGRGGLCAHPSWRRRRADLFGPGLRGAGPGRPHQA